MSDGYTLYAPLTGTGEVYLIDIHGRTVHRWDLPYRPGRHARLLADGTLAYNGVLPGRRPSSRCGTSTGAASCSARHPTERYCANTAIPSSTTTPTTSTTAGYSIRPWRP
ncbi:hypothetical protein ACFQ3Z_03415 [Streptomyces nogalater]